ncbi:IS200/IS605 family accessory protein TnpB-related protein [Desulfurobacterium thermolithotrophum]|uniref:IS200/IS605 family accessory protein TnpB-related protein n=1 Tax=Desulfurobacterium thermolithotrophum TaxID=64160 RepID=UPI00398549D3
MITIQCRLELESVEDETKVLEFLRNFSSCMRYAYNRLLEGVSRKELKKHLQLVFPLNSRYCDDAILKANEVLKSCKERKQNPKKLVFGSRKLFEKLSKKHLTGKRREKLKKEWKEKRQGTAYSRGDKSKKGNLNLRFVFIDGKLYLRINTGKRNYTFAKVHRNVQKGRAQKDKWVNFIKNLLIGKTTGKYVSYSVELKKRNGKIYAFVSFKEKIPEISIAKENGVIGIDVNASLFHIAYAEVKEDGNLKTFGRMSLNELIGKSKGEREILSWKVAHQIVNLAKEKRKAIVIEDLKKLPRGNRGDGKKKLRKRFQQFIYKGILQKVEVLAKRERIEVIKVNPAFTSVIGQLKYAPQYRIDKDVAGAFVIGRRGMGFREEIPENYLKLLKKEEFLEYSLQRLEEKKKELKEKLEGENNKWKRKALKEELKKINLDIKAVKEEIKILKSSGSDSATRQQTSGGNKSVRGLLKERRKSWRILRAVLTFPLLGKSFIRDFSPLRPVLVEGKWERVVKGLVPVPGAGAEGSSKKPPAGALSYSEEAEYKYPSQNCTNVQFC